MELNKGVKINQFELEMLKQSGMPKVTFSVLSNKQIRDYTQNLKHKALSDFLLVMRRFQDLKPRPVANLKFFVAKGHNSAVIINQMRTRWHFNQELTNKSADEIADQI